jgi:uroporphyrinogen decarboxylase
MKNEGNLERKERLLAAFRRESLDRLPVQLDFSPKMLLRMYKEFETNGGGEESLLPFLDNHLVYAFMYTPFGRMRRHDYLPGTATLLDDWGVGFDMTQEGLFLTDYPLKKEPSLSGFHAPDGKNSELMKYAKMIVPAYSGSYIVSSYQVTALFERAYALRDYENFLCDMLAEEDFANEVLDKIMDYGVNVAKQYVANGVTCGRIGDDYGTQNGMLFSPKIWREMFKPRLKRIIDVYKENGLPVILHSCGDVRSIIPDLIELGVDVLNPVQPEAMPIDELAEKFSDKLSFYGGISTQKVLPNGTEEEIYDEVKHVISCLGQRNGYIISTGIAITSDVPIKNVKALLRAIKELNR